jgi:hypothetical protein
MQCEDDATVARRSQKDLNIGMNTTATPIVVKALAGVPCVSRPKTAHSDAKIV